MLKWLSFGFLWFPDCHFLENAHGTLVIQLFHLKNSKHLLFAGGVYFVVEHLQ